jgi:tetratricopeptide (TPR) repeat protein
VRPEFKRRFDELAAQAKTAADNNDRVTCAMRWHDAADAFKGSTEADERDLRYRAICESALHYRASKRWLEAEDAYTEWGEEISRDLSPTDPRVFFAPYYIGLTRSAKGDRLGAIEAFSKALAGFASLKLKDECRATSAALGLEQLRELDFAGAVETLRKVAGDPREDETQASILHNLCLAARRAGMRELAAPFGAQAAAIRKKLNGANHPMLVETELVWAQAMIAQGQLEEAEPIIQRSAASVLSGAGESHPYFADALLAEGLRQALKGDGTAGEALARRAMFICDRCGESADRMTLRKADQTEIRKAWRPTGKASGGGELAIWKARLRFTLRRYQVNQLSFVGSGDRDRTWLFFVPKELPKQNAKLWSQIVFADINQHLNAREPADVNFLDATGCEVSELSGEDLLGFDYAALYKDIVWEPAAAFSIGNGTSASIDPISLGRVLGAWFVLHGIAGDHEKALQPFGLQPGELAASRSEPLTVLHDLLLAPLA